MSETGPLLDDEPITTGHFEQLLRESAGQVYRKLARPGLLLAACFLLIGAITALCSGDPEDWHKLSVPLGVTALLSTGLWLSMRARLSRAWTYALCFACASLPGLRMIVGAAWDPLTPARYIYSPDISVWVLIILFAGSSFDRWLPRALGLWCAAQYLLAFWLARSSLAALDGPPELIASLASVDMALVHALMFVLLGLIAGQTSAIVRELVYGIVTGLDTQRQRAMLHALARAEAERLSEAKSAFLANLSHELRAPIAASTSHLRELLRSPLLEAQERGNLQSALVGYDHLCALTEDLLDLAKIEAQRTRSEPRPVHIRGLVDELVRLMRPRARQAQLELSVEIDPNVPQWIHADPKHLRQVLLNLLRNALDYTERGGVSVALTGGESLRFAVRDTGPGLAPEHAAQIFEPFTRGHEARGRGAGLGLAISRELVALMGGELTLDTALGHGSEFWFRLPLMAQPLASFITAESSSTPPSHTPRPELEALLEVALDGNMKRLVEKLQALEARSPQAEAFVAQLIDLARRYEDEMIVTVLEQALGDTAV